MKTLTLSLFLLTNCLAFSQQLAPFSKNNIQGFKENKGQVRDQYWLPRNDVKYYGEWSGLSCHFKQSGMHYTLTKNEGTIASKLDASVKHESITDLNQVSSFRVDIEWLNANQNATIEAIEPFSSFEHYYNVPEGNQPALYVKTYNKIVYKELYKGIDLVWFTNENGQPEYDFVLAPGADFHQIQIQINGGSLLTNNQNELIIKTPFGDIIEGGLKVFQNNKLLSSKWIVQNGVVTLAIENHKPELAMVIDPPVRVWGTYLGGNQLDIAFNTGLSENNTILFSGTTASTNNIATSGSHMNTYAGGVYDAFFSKFYDDGSMIYTTYYGGNNTDEGGGIGIDQQYNIYFSGYTNSSSNIATPGVHSSNLNGQVDGFLVKFDQNGIRTWGSYFGSAVDDFLQSIAVVQSTGEVYITGYVVNSSTGQDGYLAKFTTGGQLLWRSNINGSGQDRSFVVKINEQNNPFIAGWTTSTSNISTVGTFQPTYQSNTDGFIMSYDSSGTKNWGTYFGGSSSDQVFGLEVSDNVIYIAGVTSSTTGIASTGAFKTTKDVGQDGFVAAFNLNGTRIWGTYYGGNSTDQIWRVERKESRIYVGGITESTNNIATTDGFLTTKSGGVDAFIAKFSISGMREYATYYGGLGSESFYLLEVDQNLNIYFGGQTASTSGIATVNGYQTALGANTDAFFAQFRDCARIRPQIINNGSDTFCVNQNVQLTAQFLNAVSADSIIWFADSLNGSAIGFNQIINFPATKSMKIYAIAFNICGRSEHYDSISIVVKPDTMPSLAPSLLNTRTCIGDTIRLSSGNSDTTNQYSWTGPAGFTSALANPIRPSIVVAFAGAYSVRAISSKGCVNVASVNVGLSTMPTAVSNSPICEGDSLRLFAVNANIQNWAGPNGFTSFLRNPTIKTIDSTFSGIYSATMVSNVGCTASVNLQVSVSAKPIVDITNKANWCVTDTVRLTAISNGTTYTWSGPNGFASTQLNPTVLGNFRVNGGKYKLQATSAGGCANADSFNLSLSTLPIANIVTSVCSGDTIKFRTFNANNLTWTGPSGFVSSDSIVRIPNASSINTGAYKVVMSNGGVCFDSLSFSLNVNPRPVLAIATDTAICTGDTMSVAAVSGLTSYAWSGPAGFTWSMSSFTRVNVQPNFSGFYRLTGVGVGNCSSRDSVFVRVNLRPQVAIVSNTGVCEGDTLVLNTNQPFASYNWVGPSDLQSNNRQVTVLNASKVYEGNYRLTVVDSNGCKNTTEQQVQIRRAIRPANLATNAPICAGNTLSLAAGGTGIVSTKWTSPTNGIYTGSQAFVPNVQLGDNGFFALQTIDQNGCVFDTTVSVNILALPAITAASNGPVCRGGTLELVAIKTDNGTALWRGPNGYATTALNPMRANMQFGDSGYYTITFTNTSGCANSDSVMVQVVICASVEEQIQSKPISLYPNPSTGFVTIELPLNHNVDTIELFSMDGKLAQTIGVAQGEAQVNSQLGLANGLYLVQFSNGNTVHRGKLLIAK